MGDKKTVEEVNREIRKGIPDSKFTVTGRVKDKSYSASGNLFFTLNWREESLKCRVNSSVLENSIDPKKGHFALVKGKLVHSKDKSELLLDISWISDKTKPVDTGFSVDESYEPEQKTLPTYPEKIGVISAANSSGLADIESVIQRAPPAEIDFWNTAMKGKDVEENIIQGIEELSGCDVIIIGRGGGSYQDMKIFNSSELARAVANSEIPIVTGIGHSDTETLVDKAATESAITPSDAARKTVAGNLNIEEVIYYQRKLLKAYEKQIGITAGLKSKLADGTSIPEKPGEILDWVEKLIIDLENGERGKDLKKGLEAPEKLERKF